MNSLQLLDFIATFAFALVGARVAASKNMDYGGIAFVAAVSALSGGTLRNLTLNLKPAWLVEPYLLIAVGLAVAITCVALYQTDLDSALRAIISGSVVVAVRLLSVKYRINLPKIK